jgi:hypothetical protein
MRQHSFNLLVRGLFQECIVDDDLLLPGQASEVGVAVRGAFGAIDNVQLRKWELEFSRQCFDGFLQRARFERLEFVKQRNDEDGVDGDGDQADGKREDPEVVEEARPGLFDDGKHSSANWCPKGNGQSLSLELIHQPQVQRHLVESKGFLEHEVVVVGERQLHDRIDEAEEEEE